MTYNPRIQNLDNNIIDLSGNISFPNTGNYISSTVLIVDNLSASNVFIDTYDNVLPENFKISTIKRNVKKITTNYNLLNSDSIILASASSGDLELKLPPASSSFGKQYIIKKTDSTNNSINIVTNKRTTNWYQNDILSSIGVYPKRGTTIGGSGFFKGTALSADGNILATIYANNLTVFRSSSINDLKYNGWYQDNNSSYLLTNVYNYNDSSPISIDSKGNTIIIGDYNIFQNYSASVDVYKYNNESWYLETKLSSSGRDGNGLNDRFGFSADINGDGNIVVVGSPYSNTPSGSSGAVVVFRSSSVGWYEEAFLSSSGVGSPLSDSLGYSVATNKKGDMIIAGSPYAGSDSGIVVIYRSSSNGWKEEAILNNTSNDQNNAQFGFSVDINDLGDRIAVGVPFFDQTLNNRGSVAIFESSSVGWTKLANLISAGDGTATDDQLGYNVRINNSGYVVAAAMPASDLPTSSAGSIIVFSEDSLGSWIQTILTGTYTTDDNLATNNNLGINFDMDSTGNKIASALYFYDYPYLNKGGIITFENNRYFSTPIPNNTSSIKTVWSQKDLINSEKTIEKIVSSPRNFFGYNTALSNNGNILICSSPEQSTPSGNLGSAPAHVDFSEAGIINVFRAGTNGFYQESILSSSGDGSPEQANLGTYASINNNGNTIASILSVNLANPGSSNNETAIAVFKSSSTGWRQEQLITASNDVNPENVGLVQPEINFNGNKIVDIYTNTGSIVIFNSSSTGWREEALITSSNNYSFSYVTITSGNLIFANNLNAVNSNNTGSIVIYNSSSTGWSLQSTLTSSLTGTLTKFSTNSSGNIVAVFVENSHPVLSTSSTSSLSIFKSSSNGWREEYFIQQTGSSQYYYRVLDSNDVYKKQISINNIGDTIVVGNDHANYSNKTNLIILLKSSSLGWKESYINFISSSNVRAAPDNYNLRNFAYNITLNGSGNLIAASYPVAYFITGSKYYEQYGVVAVFTTSSVEYDLIDGTLTSSINTKDESITLVSDGEFNWYKI